MKEFAYKLSAEDNFYCLYCDGTERVREESGYRYAMHSHPIIHIVNISNISQSGGENNKTLKL